MNVELEKKFPLQSSSDAAWTLLRDIESVANCMPGAEITEVVDENNFKGKVRVKLGPVQMEFNGDIAVQSIDPDNSQIQLMATGKDKKGTSSVSMDLTANIAPGDDTPSALLGDAKVVVNGKLASFGQRMMAQVSDQILEQFADNFRAKLGTVESSDAGNGESESTESENSGPDNIGSESAGADAVTASVDSTGSQQAPVVESNATSTSPAKSESGSNEINGFRFALTAIIGLITGLFKRK